MAPWLLLITCVALITLATAAPVSLLGQKPVQRKRRQPCEP